MRLRRPRPGKRTCRSTIIVICHKMRDPTCLCRADGWREKEILYNKISFSRQPSALHKQVGSLILWHNAKRQNSLQKEHRPMTEFTTEAMREHDIDLSTGRFHYVSWGA